MAPFVHTFEYFSEIFWDHNVQQLHITQEIVFTSQKIFSHDGKQGSGWFFSYDGLKTIHLQYL